MAPSEPSVMVTTPYEPVLGISRAVALAASVNTTFSEPFLMIHPTLETHVFLSATGGSSKEVGAQVTDGSVVSFAAHYKPAHVGSVWWSSAASAFAASQIAAEPSAAAAGVIVYDR